MAVLSPVVLIVRPTRARRSRYIMDIIRERQSPRLVDCRSHYAALEIRLWGLERKMSYHLRTSGVLLEQIEVEQSLISVIWMVCRRQVWQIWRKNMTEVTVGQSSKFVFNSLFDR